MLKFSPKNVIKLPKTSLKHHNFQKFQFFVVMWPSAAAISTLKVNKSKNPILFIFPTIAIVLWGRPCPYLKLYSTNLTGNISLVTWGTVWKSWKSDAKITARAISTFLWFFLLNVFFGYIWWQTWVYFDFEAFLTVQWSPKVECLTQILSFSSFLPVFWMFLYHCGHFAQKAPQCTPQHLSYSFSYIKILKNWDEEVV